MLTLRIGTHSYDVQTAPDATALEILNALRDAVKRHAKAKAKDADLEALAEAAQEGDAQKVKRMIRKLKL